MPTLNYQVNESNDDVECYVSTPSYDYTITDARMGRTPLYADAYAMGVKFDVTIPAGVVIDSATLQVYQSSETGNPLIKIEGQDDDVNPSFDVNETRTDAQSNFSSHEDNGWVSKDVKSIISELYSEHDYSSGGGIILWFSIQNAVAGHYREFRTWDYLDNSYGAKLTIEYSIPTWDDAVNINDEDPSAVSYEVTGRQLVYDIVDGRIYSLFGRNSPMDIYLAWSDDGGSTWDSSLMVTSTVGDLTPAGLAIDSSRNLHLTWYDEDEDIIYYRRRQVGGSLDSVEEVNNDTYTFSYESTIAVDDSDNLHVVWFQENASMDLCVWHRVRSAAGVWGAISSEIAGVTRPLINISDSTIPAIAFDSSGDLHLITGEEALGFQVLYHYTWDGSWDSGELVFNPADTEYIPASISVIVDADDTIHIVWGMYDISGGTILVHNKKPYEGVWALTAFIDAALECDLHEGIFAVSTSIDRAGNLYVFYNRSDDEEPGYTSIYSSTYTSWWTAPAELLEVLVYEESLPWVPVAMYSNYPQTSPSPNIPDVGYAFVFTDIKKGSPAGIWFYSSSDIDWPEGSGVPHTKSLSDTVSIAELLVSLTGIARYKTLSDILNIAEFTKIFAVDGSNKKLYISEGMPVSESSSRNYYSNLDDQTSLSDSIVIIWDIVRELSDYESISELISKEQVSVFSDSITLSDNNVLGIGKGIAEELPLIEVVNKDFTKILSDTESITEVLDFYRYLAMELLFSSEFLAILEFHRTE